MDSNNWNELGIKPEPLEEEHEGPEQVNFSVNWLRYEIKGEVSNDPALHDGMNTGNKKHPQKLNSFSSNKYNISWHSTSGDIHNLQNSQIQGNSQIVPQTIDDNGYSANDSGDNANIKHETDDFNCNHSDADLFEVQNKIKLKSNKLDIGNSSLANSHPCDVCNKVFARRGDLIKHFRIHTKEKPYKCEICDKTFSQSSSLRTHAKVHTNEKPFLCDICNKAFARRADLKKHFRIHTREKPYKCDICEKTFSQSSSLSTHSKIHTNEKPYLCVFCNKAFKLGVTLKGHLMTHTNEKPYSCDVCGKAFSDSSNLKRHFRVHTKEKFWSSDACNNMV